MLIPSWFWMIYHLLFVVECRSLCCHGNSIEFIGPFIQNDFPDFISWWIMWLLLPSTKQFLKSFILQRAQTPRWLFSCFWNTNEFQMHLGTFPLHRVRGTKPPCISEPTGCIKSLCKQGKPVFLEGTVITVGKRERGLEVTVLWEGAVCAPSLWAQLQLCTCPLQFRSENEKEKWSALP